MKPQTKRQNKPRRRGMFLALGVVVLCGLLLWGVLHVILSVANRAGSGQEGYGQADVAAYLCAQWPNYPLETYEGNTVTVHGSALITYAQAEKYGAASYDSQMLESYVSTAQAIATGLQTECGLTGVQVILAQFSTDGQIIFTASSDGSVDTCWDQPV